MAFLKVLASSEGGSTSFINSQILTDIGTLLTTVFGWVTSNTYLMVFFTIGLVGAGIGIFRKLKRSVNG